MRELSDWLEQQAARERRIVLLEDALLGDRFWAYAWYRLRFFFARYLARSAIHAVTVVLLYRIFSQREFVAILAVYAATSLASSFWWGALEAMRGEVRTLYRAGKPHLIGREIGRWLALSLLLAAGALTGTAVWIAAHGTLGPADAYVAALGLRLALELVSRCYHSGVYAIRRIYRPLTAILAVEVVGLAGVLALWPIAHAWSFPAAAALSALTVTGLTFHYTRRAYRFFGFDPFRALARPRLRAALPELFAAGSAYAVMSLDALLVLALLGAGGRPLDDTMLFALFFAVGPTVRAGFEWAQLLYFDLKRLELRVFRNVRAHFERRMLRLALLLGLVFWLLASAIATAVYGRSLGAFYPLLAPFFLARGLLAVVQIQAFAERAYAELLKNAGFCAGGVVAAGVLVDGEQATVVALTVVTLAGFALLRLREEHVHRAMRAREVLWLSEWLAEVSAQRGPTRISAVRFPLEPRRFGRDSVREWEDENRWRHRRFAERLAGWLHGHGGVTVIQPGFVVWFERGGSTPAIGERRLHTEGGGLIERLGATPLEPDGPAALASARALSLLGPGFGTGGVVVADEVRLAFRRLFPDGVVYAPDEPLPAELAALSSQEKRIVMLDAAVFARDFRPSGRRSRFDVTAFCTSGELRLIFVTDRSRDRGRRLRWRSLVRELNVKAALGEA